MSTVGPLVIPSQDPRLKRRINHDPRSRQYPVDTAGLTLTDVEWAIHIGVLDQGDVGKCTAEAACETLASEPFYGTLPNDVRAALGDQWTDGFYSDEEVLDGTGPYPPHDEGSDGLTSAKVAKARGLISGYQHTFSVDAALLALQKAPGSWGTYWRSDMDAVNEDTGEVKYSGTVRGGHEMCVYKVDVKLERVWFRQSWGAWGYQRSGVGWISFADYGKSLADQGDMTFYVPLSKPAPTPTPTPPPAAGSSVTFTADQYAVLAKWAGGRTCAGTAAARRAWKAATA